MDKKYLILSIWTKLIINNRLLLIWNSILAVGGLALLGFVLSNGFLPELDLAGAISLLASSSLVSLMLISSLFLLTTAGGLTMLIWYKDTDPQIRGNVTGLVAILVSSGLYISLAYLTQKAGITRNAFIGCAIIVALIAMGIAYSRRNRSTWSWNLINKPWIMIGAALIVSALISTNQAVIFAHFYREPLNHPNLIPWLSFGAWLLAQAAFMWIVASHSTPKDALKITFPLGAFGIVILLALSNNPALIVNRMAQMLGIGALNNVRLVVTHTGCDILSAVSNGQLCNPTVGKSTYLIENVVLLSRFGKQIAIEYKKDKMLLAQPSQSKFMVVLPSTEMLGWEQKTQ